MIALDIETIPDMSKIRVLPEVEASKVLKDPIKIANDIESKKAKQIEKMALSPFTGRICAFATANDVNSSVGFLGEISDEAERHLIKDIFSKITKEVNTNYNATVSPFDIVTFNGIQFDLPFIYTRAMLLKMDVPKSLSFWTKRYSNSPHYDLRMVLNGWNFQAEGSLDYFAKAILGKDKIEGIGYNNYVEYIESGRGEEIAQECRQHTKLTWEMYKVVSKYF